MQALNIEWLLFEHEEYAKATEIAKSVISEYVFFNKEAQEVTITYGLPEEQVGLWLVDIVNSKLI